MISKHIYYSLISVLRTLVSILFFSMMFVLTVVLPSLKLILTSLSNHVSC